MKEYLNAIPKKGSRHSASLQGAVSGSDCVPAGKESAIMVFAWVVASISYIIVS